MLSNIANNINQLARHCNTIKEAPQRDILNAIFNELKGCDNKMPIFKAIKRPGKNIKTVVNYAAKTT